MDMTLWDWLLLLAIAALCGSLGQAISGYSRGGCLVSIALGFIGALIGHQLQKWLKLPELFTIKMGKGEFPIIWAIIGATLFVAIIGFLSRPRRGG